MTERARLSSIAALAGAFLSLVAMAGGHPAEVVTRPKITGIASVRLYVSNMDRSRAFYSEILRLLPEDRCSAPNRSCFLINPGHHIELEPVPSPAPQNWVAQIAFATDDVARMRRYLLAHGVHVGAISKEGDGPPHFELLDPEGNAISFVGKRPPEEDYPNGPNQLSDRMLHAGFVVKDMAKENRFYRDILGFRLYWHGGFKDDGLDWYEIQVPDGDNWIEYMLNIPANADHKELGVQNHFSLGVNDAQAAAAQLRKNGLETFDGPEIGRDGKNSLDAYDPDATRVEVMEFSPRQKPCCHPYQAAHPIQ